MKQRTLTGVVLALISMALLSCFHFPYVPELTALCLGCGAVWEILGAYGVKSRALRILGYAYAILLPFFPFAENKYWMLVLLVLGLGYFTYLMYWIGKPAKAWMPGVSVFFAVSLYRGLAAYGKLPHGAVSLCLTGVICALTDIFAYLVGSRFGKHKLAPKVSPGKSMEGALGGLIATVVIVTLVFTPYFGNAWLLALYACVCSILGQWGDLSMSAVKRVAGVKDFGKIFPGHGGILDRCDSMMYPLAFTWLLYCFLK